MSKRIETFYEFDFRDFLTEIKKYKIILSIADQADWKDYFEKTKANICQIKLEIERADAEVDQIIYGLYGLTRDEIKIVEESI